MKVEFHPSAEHELVDAALYYESRVRDLGSRFLAEIERVTGLVAEHPEIGHTIDGDVYRLVLRRFPYSLIYARKKHEVYVLAIAHHKRRPGYWRSRVDS